VTAASEFFRVTEVALSKLFGLTPQRGRGMPPRERPLPPWIDPQRPPTREEREARVASLEVNVPKVVELRSGQVIIFSAVPVDFEGNAVHGLVAEWESSDSRVIFIGSDGRAVAGEPGTAFVTASAGHKKEKVQVIVASDEAANQEGGSGSA
jgi:hypothetical protein